MGCQAYRSREALRKCRNFQQISARALAGSRRAGEARESLIRDESPEPARAPAVPTTSHRRGKRKTLARLAFRRFFPSFPWWS